jgi:hypothetical protein
MWQGDQDKDNTNDRIPRMTLISTLNSFECKKRGATREPKCERREREKHWIGRLDERVINKAPNPI